MIENNRQEATRIAREILAQKPVYLDTETTGTENKDQVIEIAVLDWDAKELLSELVKPSVRISPGSAQVHGITDAFLAWAPEWQQVWPMVEDALRGRYLAIYNAQFDLRLIQQSCLAANIHWHPPYAKAVCVMELFAQYYGEINPHYGSYRWKSLDFAGKYFNIPEQNSHRALQDTKLTRLVLEKMAEGEDLQIQ